MWAPALSGSFIFYLRLNEVTTCDDIKNLRSLSLDLFDVMEDVGASIVWLINLLFKVLMK